MIGAKTGIPDRKGVTYETAFVGPGMRGSERLHYIPSRLSLVPKLFANAYPPDVVLIHTSTPNDGRVSLGVETNILPAAISATKENGGLVIAQANPNMPYTFGDSEIALDALDYLVEIEEEIRTHSPTSSPDLAQIIGELVAAEIPDGATLQAGIGAVPDAVLAELKNRKGLRVWTELFSDGLLALHHAGALDEQATINASFLFGSAELYQWVDQNPKIRIHRTEVSNDPSRITKQTQMTSVNAALQVDLFDQANATRVKGHIYSGIGGSVDFIEGAMHSSGGQAFVTLPSWHEKSDTSTIVPRLTEAATHFQHSAIATEQGIARTFGETERDQALNLINHAAHPRARAGLLEAAREMGLI
jgi:acyl-CoA hydrolase